MHRKRTSAPGGTLSTPTALISGTRDMTPGRESASLKRDRTPQSASSADAPEDAAASKSSATVPRGSNTHCGSAEDIASASARGDARARLSIWRVARHPRRFFLKTRARAPRAAARRGFEAQPVWRSRTKLEVVVGSPPRVHERHTRARLTRPPAGCDMRPGTRDSVGDVRTRARANRALARITTAPTADETRALMRVVPTARTASSDSSRTCSCSPGAGPARAPT